MSPYYSTLAIPVAFWGETDGAIAVVDKRDQAHYTEEEVTFLETFLENEALPKRFG